MPHVAFSGGPCMSTGSRQTTVWNSAVWALNPERCRKCFRSQRDSARTRKVHPGIHPQHSGRMSAAAAAGTDTSVDLKQMLQEALQSPPQDSSPAPGSEAATDSATTKLLDTTKIPSPGAADQGYLGQIGVPPGAPAAAEGVKSQAAPAAQAVKSQAQQVVPDKVEPIMQGLQPPAVPEGVAGSTQSAGEQLQSQLKSTTDLIPSPNTAAGEASNSVTQQVSEATSAAVQSVQDASGNLLDSFNQAVPGLQSSVESTTTSLFSQVSEAAASIMDALPAPAAEALQAVAAAVQPSTDKLWAYASSDPKAGAAATGLVVGLPLLALWRARLGGYSGQLQPAKAFELLNKSDTLLIDIRKEEVRNVEGVPVLKRGSRGKGVAVSIQAVAAAVARSAKQGQSIGLQIAALQILGLKQVKRGTRLVIMDQSGGAEAITIARNLRQLSRRKVYVLAGGFSAWEKQGLDVQSTGVNYQTTVFDSLSDEAEGLVERASSIFRDPVIAAGGVGGVALAGVALVDWHYSMRYVGVVGTQLTLISWLTSYDSPQDALSDVGSSFQKFSKKANALIGSRSSRTPSPVTAQALDSSYEQPSADTEGGESPADGDQPSNKSARSQETSVTRSS